MLKSAVPLNIRQQLRELLRSYKDIDSAHGLPHVKLVARRALELSTKLPADQRPDKLKTYLTAMLHDIGNAVNRETHELVGADMVKAHTGINKVLSPETVAEIANAIKQHRSSTGVPATVMEKVISDADRLAENDAQDKFMRAYNYGRDKLGITDHNINIQRAAEHMVKKYGPGGKGTRLYLPESVDTQARLMSPILNNTETLADGSIKIKDPQIFNDWAAAHKKQAAITLDIEKGDTLLGGRFKNIKTIVKDIGTDDLGQPTINGKKLLSFRIAKAMTKKAQINEMDFQGLALVDDAILAVYNKIHERRNRDQTEKNTVPKFSSYQQASYRRGFMTKTSSIFVSY